jgi:hypothetical protein
MVMMVMMEMLMEMPPPTSRRSGDDDGVDFPFTGGTGAADLPSPGVGEDFHLPQ